MQPSPFFIGPHQTPKSIKWLIAFTVLISLLSPPLTFFLERSLHLAGPGAWLSLSLFGLKQGWYWEPLTYFFLQSAGIGISFSLLLSLFFQMLLLWFAGSAIDLRYGSKKFLLFYFGAGLFAGGIATFLLWLFSSQTVVVGSSPPVYALMVVWVMLNAELELSFFFLIRLKAKWLVAIYLGVALLMNLSYGAIIPALVDLAGIVWGFCFGRFVWKLPNPYPLNLEFKALQRKRKLKEDKIIDISVFQENDEAFMDRMLDKIVKDGENSLTKKERERMKKISAKKNGPR